MAAVSFRQEIAKDQVMPAVTYDKTEMLQLLARKPRLTSYEVARLLTMHNLRSGRASVLVTVNTVDKARHRFQPQLRAMGVHARGTSALITELKRRTGHPTLPSEQHYNSRALRYLRLLSRVEAGKPIPPRDRGELESWETELRATRRVVDVTPDGVPYTRRASDGELIHGELRPGGKGLLTCGK
jgi:hypothetical protein